MVCDMVLLLRGIGLSKKRGDKENGQGRHEVIRDGLQRVPFVRGATNLRRQSQAAQAHYLYTSWPFKLANLRIRPSHLCLFLFLRPTSSGFCVGISLVGRTGRRRRQRHYDIWLLVHRVVSAKLSAESLDRLRVAGIGDRIFQQPPAMERPWSLLLMTCEIV